MAGEIDPPRFDERIEALTAALESLTDADARAMAKELVALVLRLHREGLKDIVAAVGDDEPARRRLLASPIVRSLLALHDVECSPAAPLIQISRRASAPSVAAPDAPQHVGVCSRCGTRLENNHRHVIDLQSRLLSCSCRACWLLAGSTGGSRSERAVPNRYRREPAGRLSDAQWEALRIPVDVVFFMTNSEAGRTFAFYPGPAGPTESALSLDSWKDVVAGNPWLREMAPDVEALLVRRARQTGVCDCFIVPIDACYELVGRIRLGWTGLPAGSDDVLDSFFADVIARCQAEAGGSTHAHP